ncbi:hypothetical protein DNTS_021889 [Danionella cerebrum]|uniref:Rab effector MyRIP/Melanophilin domain-containing protein n=1 Tax=Danionella cerebrum TaxID=2873325 RepID=A0A553QK84_9TELE|nr:hypothetical protein DNTS_021889 [Danionella translucida]
MVLESPVQLLRTQALEWFYNNVKSRFNRCGSAKVLKTLYRKHIIERGALSELPEVSAHEGSNDNGSVCDGSDSTIYKQSEGNNVEDTLTVALRVAEEAIEEAIAKAESYKDSLIIQSGKRPEIQAGIEFVWPQNESSGPLRSTSGQQNTSQQGAGAQIDSSQSYPLWDPEGDTAQGVLERAEVEAGIQNYSSLRRESRASSLPGQDREGNAAKALGSVRVPYSSLDLSGSKSGNIAWKKCVPEGGVQLRTVWKPLHLCNQTLSPFPAQPEPLPGSAQPFLKLLISLEHTETSHVPASNLSEASAL